MAYHNPPDDPSRWQRELDHLQFLNNQLRSSLRDARDACDRANKEAAAYREEVIDLKNKIEAFWDSIEGARAMFVRSFPNYNSYRDSHKRGRETDERERLSRKSQRLDAPATGSSSAADETRRTRPYDFPPETGAYPQGHDYRALPRGQPHLTMPVAGADKHYSNGRSPYDTHPPGPYPDPAHPHVDPTRGHSASPHLATRIPSHQGHRHAPSDPNAYPPPEPQALQTHARRESGDPMLIPRQRRPANAEQATTRSSPSPSAPPQHIAGAPIDSNPNRPALPPAGAIIIHPPAAFQVSFTDLQPGIFLDRSDFGVEYPPNLDPPQGLQAVRCLFCDKHYSGANARSLWRRHVMGKHDFTMKGQRASTARTRHLPQASTVSAGGELPEPAPPSSVPAASPVQPQPPASSRPPEVRPPPQRAPSPGHNRSRRPEGEGEHPESEDDQEAFDYQRHRSRNEPRKGPDGAPSGPNGTGSPLTHAALESWNKGSGAGSGGDVARWQGQGPVPGKPSGQGPAPNPKPDDEEQTVASQEATAGDKQREWCLCRRPDSWGGMIRCDMPTCAIQWYHARCVGMDPDQAKAKQEWICEDCNRKTAQRRQEAHRDGPLVAVQEKERASNPRTPEPSSSQNPPPKANSRPESRNQSRREDDDVVMRPAESGHRQTAGNNDAASHASDEEPARGGGRKPQGRRVVSESQSPQAPQDTQREGADAQPEPSARAPPVSDDNARQSEPPDQAKSSGTPKKKGWKGYALVAAEGAPQSDVVTTPGGTRRTRSGKTFFLEDGRSASDGDRQQSMETN